MLKFNSSDLTNNRSEVLRQAIKAPTLIQYKNTNSVVTSEYVIMTKSDFDKLDGNNESQAHKNNHR